MRYFIVTYYQKPNGKFSEQAKVDTKIKNKDMVTASVIIDYRDRKIIKSRFRGELGDNDSRDFDTINNFYKEHYPDIVAQLEAKYQVLEEIVEGVKAELKAEVEEAVASRKATSDMEATDDMEATSDMEATDDMEATSDMEATGDIESDDAS